MFRKIIVLLVSVLFLISLSGCVAILAGAAGGVGTATWLSGKLSQEVNTPFERTLEATKSGLKSLRLDVKKETIKGDVAQVMSNYTDGRTVWIDIHKVSESISRVDIRVGATGDKGAARKILNRIIRYL